MGVLEGGETAVEIMNGLKSFFSKGDTQLLGQINGKLDTVLANQALIFKEIASLKLWVSEALTAEAQDVVTRHLIAVNREYDIIMSGSNPDNNVLANVLTDAIPSTLTLGSYGFDAFIPYSCGVAMCLALLKFQNWRDGSESATKKEFKAAYDAWLSPDNKNGIVAAMVASQATIDAETSTLNQMPRQYVNSDVPTDMSGEQRCDVVVYLNINGDLNSGFSGSLSAPQNLNCHTVPHQGDGGNCLTAGRQNVPGAKAILGRCPIFKTEVLGERQLALDTLRRTYAHRGITPANLRFDGSGYAQVDEFNAQRQTILNETDRLHDLQAMKDQMTSLSKALA